LFPRFCLALLHRVVTVNAPCSAQNVTLRAPTSARQTTGMATRPLIITSGSYQSVDLLCKPLLIRTVVVIGSPLVHLSGPQAESAPGSITTVRLGLAMTVLRITGATGRAGCGYMRPCRTTRQPNALNCCRGAAGRIVYWPNGCPSQRRRHDPGQLVVGHAHRTSWRGCAKSLRRSRHVQRCRRDGAAASCKASKEPNLGSFQKDTQLVRCHVYQTATDPRLSGAGRFVTRWTWYPAWLPRAPICGLYPHGTECICKRRWVFRRRRVKPSGAALGCPRKFPTVVQPIKLPLCVSASAYLQAG
jgi:hypothetical protein